MGEVQPLHRALPSIALIWICINIRSLDPCTVIAMAEGTSRDFGIAVIAGWILAVITGLIPFVGFIIGPLVGGFAAGSLSKGDVMKSAKAGLLAGLLAAIVITISAYRKVVDPAGMGYPAGWATGLTLYLIIGLDYICLAFIGAILASVTRK